MTDTIIMRGAYAITDPRLGASGVLLDGAVVIMDGTVTETGPFSAIAPKYPDIGVIGDGTQLLMPGLVDAHSHGRGLSPIQKGVRNDFLENALFDWAINRQRSEQSLILPQRHGENAAGTAKLRVCPASRRCR
jgi:5-methylthioadenosine/S-adenosylhomocysteine deaminase